MLRLSTLTLLLAILTSCAASPYYLSESSLELRSSLSHDKALDVIKTLSVRNDQQVGLCNAHTNRNDQPARVVGFKNTYMFYSSLREDLEDVNATSTRITLTYKKYSAIYRIDLSNIGRIRVMPDSKFPNCPMKEITVTLYEVKSIATSVKIHVTNDNLDLMLAALTTLSPNARLMQGVGF